MQNMWQVPSEEVNRPGSFSSHARKNVELLVQVLSELEDTQTLLVLAQYLRTKPDVAKQYLRDNERVATQTKVPLGSIPPLYLISLTSLFHLPGLDRGGRGLVPPPPPPNPERSEIKFLHQECLQVKQQ